MGIKYAKERIKNDTALMGPTHSLSSVALYLIIIAFFPTLIPQFLGTESLYILIASIFVIYGASRLPDWDNTTSSVISSLGVLGRLLSMMTRSISVLVFNMTKTKYDKPEANPHRGFFHTAVSAILLFILILSTSSIETNINLFGKDYTIGSLVTIFWLFICVQVSIAGLFKKAFKKNKDKGVLGRILNVIISLIVSIFLITLGMEEATNFKWLAFAVSFGYLAHILGDTLTVAGAPLLFPFKIRGKRWYDIRFLKIKAGGDVEKYILTPAFAIVAIFALGKIIIYLK